jgi:toxin YoeB
MAPIYSTQAQEDRAYWEKHDRKIVKRIELLIADIQKTPCAGIGKPEPLRFAKSGYWSRRINHEHRLVYKVVDDQIYIAQCRYHYEK